MADHQQGVLVGLHFVKSGDARKPVGIQISVEDTDSSTIRTIDLTEHQFALLLGSSVVPAVMEVSL